MSFSLFAGNALDAYATWETPTIIVSDGPYGVGGYEGDPTSVADLPNMYEPHVKVWSERAKPNTALWFWNTEIGWATTHPILEKHGWIYKNCNIWNKGIGHVSGNCNGKTMRSFPVVTEVCVLYIRPATFSRVDGVITVQEWLRQEWRRTGLPFNKANEACGVKNAATRKYLTPDTMFYLPPPEMFEKLKAYANTHGDAAGRPYFDLPKDASWDRIWYNWNFEYGVTNVWDEPALRSKERIKDGGKATHLNQKPLALMNRIVRAVVQPGDVLWEPFGGLCTGSVAGIQAGCKTFAAEMNPRYHTLALQRLQENAGISSVVSFAA